MQDLEITWPEGRRQFSPEDSPVRVGRSSEAAVPLTEGSVSRRHLELVWSGSAWTANDSSTHGTFDPIGVRLAPQWNLDQDAVVRLGGVQGVEIQIRVVDAASNGSGSGLSSADAPAGYQPHAGGAPASYQEPAAAASAAPAGGMLFPDAEDRSRPPAVEPAGVGQDARHPAPAAEQPFDAPAAPPSEPAFEPPAYDPPQAEQPAAPAFDPLQADQPATPTFDPPAAPDAAPSAPAPPAPAAPPSEPAFEPPAYDPPQADQPAPPAFAPPQAEQPATPTFDPPAAPDAAPPAPAPPAAEPSFDPPAYEPPVAESPAPPAYDPPPSPGADFDPPASPLIGADFDPPQGNDFASPAPPSAPPGPPAAPPGPPDAPSPGGINFEQAPPAPQAGGFDAGPEPGFDPPPSPAAANPAATIISDATLRLHVAGQDYTFLPGTDVTIGRDPSCLVQLDEQHSLVSRRHLQIQYRENGWWLEDFSSKGTYVDNRRIKGAYKAEGAFIANLGDDDAGTPLRIITTGEHRVPRSWNLAVIGALAAVALLPLIALAFLLMRDSGGEPDFASAKQSTVMLLAVEGGQGSGFFVADNLIVTNQHVAALSPQMLVAVSRNADAPAEIEYATELVANHPYLDIAVLRVTNRAVIGADGVDIPADAVGEIGLPAVTLGSSGDITLGDDVFSTGFPGRLSITSADDMGNLRLPPVSATNGEAASFTIWPGCSNPDWEAFIPLDSPPGVTCSGEGDIDKGVLVSTFSSGQGASGSAVFRNNEVVAVVFAGAVDEANASLNITSDSFAAWLQEIIDNNS